MMSDPHSCPLCTNDIATLFCTVCMTTACTRCSLKHFTCGYLIPIETIIKSAICTINYLEIMQALLKHTSGDNPPPKVLSEL